MCFVGLGDTERVCALAGEVSNYWTICNCVERADGCRPAVCWRQCGAALILVQSLTFAVMIRSEKLYVVLLAFCCVASLAAKAGDAWSVDDCISYAIEHNYGLRNKRLDTGMAGADVVSAYGDFLPSVTVAGRAGRRLGRSVDPATNQYTSESFWENAVGRNVSLPIFNWLTRLNRLKFDLLNKAISGFAEKVAENDLALEVAEAYYRCCFDAEVYELAVEQRQLGERYYEKMSEYVGLGLRPRSDIQELRARLQADIYQERVKADNSLFSLSALKELMGMEVADTLTLCRETESFEPIAVHDVVLSGLYESARACLPEYQIMEMRHEASRRAVSIAAGAISPSVKLELDINTGYYTARDRNGVMPSFRTQLSDNLNRYVGVSVSVPLFDGLSRYKNIQKEKMRLQQVSNENERQRLLLTRDIYDTYISAQTAAEEWSLANEQLGAASAAWHKSEEKWHEGLISGFELMESRNLYMQARVEAVRTSLQYMLRKKMIRFYQTGSFL